MVNFERAKGVKRRLIIGIIVLVAAVVGILYLKACREARFLNDYSPVYKTDYTCWDVFWAGGTIKKLEEAWILRSK